MVQNRFGVGACALVCGLAIGASAGVTEAAITATSSGWSASGVRAYGSIFPGFPSGDLPFSETRAVAPTFAPEARLYEISSGATSFARSSFDVGTSNTSSSLDLTITAGTATSMLSSGGYGRASIEMTYTLTFSVSAPTMVNLSMLSLSPYPGQNSDPSLMDISAFGRLTGPGVFLQVLAPTVGPSGPTGADGITATQLLSTGDYTFIAIIDMANSTGANERTGFSSGLVQLHINAVPAPSAIVPLGAGLAVMARRRRR